MYTHDINNLIELLLLYIIVKQLESCKILGYRVTGDRNVIKETLL